MSVEIKTTTKMAWENVKGHLGVLRESIDNDEALHTKVELTIIEFRIKIVDLLYPKKKPFKI